MRWRSQEASGPDHDRPGIIDLLSPGLILGPVQVIIEDVEKKKTNIPTKKKVRKSISSLGGEKTWQRSAEEK